MCGWFVYFCSIQHLNQYFFFLLLFRGAPAGLSALLCQAALSQLLKSDLSSLHCTQEVEADHEDEQQVVCKFGGYICLV